MKIGYLVYNKGFSLNEFYQMLNAEISNKDNLNLFEEKITEKLLELEIEKIYLPMLELNPRELSSLDENLLDDIPIRLNDKIYCGFTNEVIRWLKGNVIFTNVTDLLYFEKKLSFAGIELWIFNTSTNQTKSSNNNEHIDSKMLMIETSIDDMNPEFYSYIMDELFAIGVNDVYITQAIMKKNRPGQILHILCRKELMESVDSIIFKETTTLGIRFVPYTVHRLEREFFNIDTEWGEMTIKVGRFSGEIVQIAPEYEECAKVAKENGVPIKFVFDTAKIKGYEKLKKGLH